MTTREPGSSPNGAHAAIAETTDSVELSKLQEKVVIITGTSNPQLADDVGQAFDEIIGAKTPTTVQHPVYTFDRGQERGVDIKTSVLGRDVLIVQPTAYNEDANVTTNDAVMEAFLLTDAAKKAGAKRIILAAVNYGYARQDRIELGHRQPNSASLLARMYDTAGVDILLTVDIHQPATEGAFSRPWKDLWGVHVFAPVLRREVPERRVIVGPDAGSAKRTDTFAKELGADMALAHKTRDKNVPNKTTTSGEIMGNVQGKHAIVVDDIAAGGGSLVAAANAVIENGALDVCGVVTHAQLYGDEALKRISDSPLTTLYIGDTIAHRRAVREHPKIRVVSFARMIAEVLYSIETDASISARLQQLDN